MVDKETVAEDAAEAVCELGGERDFRHEIKHLVAVGKHAVNQMRVYLGLAASRYPVEQYGRVAAESRVDFAESLILCRR